MTSTGLILGLIGLLNISNAPDGGKAQTYVVIRYVGSHDHPVRSAMVGASKQELRGLKRSDLELVDYVVLPEATVKEVVAYVRGLKASPGPKGLVIEWSQDGQTGKIQVSYEDICSVMERVRALSVRLSAPELERYGKYLEAEANCGH